MKIKLIFVFLSQALLVNELHASDHSSELIKVDRHILAKNLKEMSNIDIYDPNVTYGNVASGYVRWSDRSPTGWNQWVSPSGKTCNGRYTKVCLYLPVNKDKLKSDLSMSKDSELYHLLGQKIYTGGAWPVVPWTVKEIEIIGDDVILYGDDRPYQPWSYASDTPILVLPFWS